MFYLLKFLKFISFLSLNYYLLEFSSDLDYEQLLKDLEFLSITNLANVTVFFLISSGVVIVTFVIKQMLSPFIEIFIDYYYRFSFYVLINILSISATFITLRIYGYSRLNLIIYLLFASIVFEVFDRAERKFL
jgi:hypothetical protein